MTLVYITCKNFTEAKKIGLALLKKRLAACFVVISGATSFYFWSPSPTSVGEPPKKNKIAQSREAVLLVKTLRQKFPQVEREVKQLHSYTIPFIAEIPVRRAHKAYLKWLRRELYL